MGLTLVSLEDVQKACQTQDQENFNSLSIEEKEFIKQNFKLEENGLLHLYRFQVTGKKPLEAIAKKLQHKGIADYCSDLGWTIYNNLITNELFPS